MNNAPIVFLLLVCTVVLAGIVLYQQFAFRLGMQRQLKQISRKLAEIQDADSDEYVMNFTDNKALMELLAQINRLLEERKKIKADFRHSENSLKKMLSNISHDIKTPMTVILGYLEILKMDSMKENEMLLKVEQKTQQVMDLINQFFTLAKLEAGDTDIEISKIDICESCRESVLDFYEILTQKEFQVEAEIPEDQFLSREIRMLCAVFFLISYQMRYGTVQMESTWEYFSDLMTNTFMWMWKTGEKE